MQRSDLVSALTALENTLGLIEVRGQANMTNLLASIQYVKKLKEQLVQEASKEVTE